MKVHVEIDCTPDEARRFMGLPDVEKANAAYVDNLAKAILDAIKGYAFHDDAQVARLLVERRPGERERITVLVRKLS